MKPKDKPANIPDNSGEAPKLYIVVNDKKFPRPGLETAFVDYNGINAGTEESIECLCHPVSISVCSCNKVKQVCACVGYTSCSHTSQPSRTTTGCRCAPVH